ncbi:methylmalonyl-CoA mutase subunit beta [Winogradskyella sp. A3E31]|uniref:methylmalonyl-CoA mutase subunit beta n=1 Tax=Winogradskyella sp. A3E31 TaxID=3349637 RepID=UPI00398B49A9
MSKPLFNEFQPVSSKAWKQKIQYDLKGADYNDTLIWQSREGVDVKPFYHSEDFETLPEVSNIEATSWKVGQYIEVLDANKANVTARDAINRGAESIIFHVPSETVNIEELLQNIDPITIPIHLKCDFISEGLLNNTFVISNGSAKSHDQIFLHTDIIGNLAKTGNWFSNLKEDHSSFESIVKQTNQLSIDMGLYQNAGATMVQQLAYGLAHANEYLNHLDAIIGSDTKQTLQVTFNVAVGSNYFFEIAKLKTLRQLWASLASEYGVNEECQIIATPSKRNKTIYDYNTNMLRTTTECMSAILGGANTIHNLPYDVLYHKSNEFGERISRNQLLVLKHESYFDLVNNPSDGSYYIENLTQELAEKALDIFKTIETSGGFLSQLKEGTIQRKIKESAAKEQADFDAGKLTLLGTNKHPNPDDKMKNDLEKSPFLEKKKRKTLIEPIIEIRISEKLEINRLKEE